MAIQDWEQVDSRSEWINKKNGKQIVQVVPINGVHKDQLGVSVRSAIDSKGMRDIILEKYFGKFQYGLNYKDQLSQKKADNFTKKYMEKH